MRIFLDANILVSVLNKEYPLFSYSARVLSLGDRHEFALFTSPICLAIAFYFSEKKSGANRAKRKMELLVSKIKVAVTDQEAVTMALRNKSVLDFEDGLEYYSAVNAGCHCIVTEDTSDFHFSEMEVLNSAQFLEYHAKHLTTNL